MKTANAAPKEKFTGTVADLAGQISINGSEPLSLQDLQFLTRIGSGSFAKKVGNAPGTGTRGGKRAAIWEINPTARLVLTAAANDAPVASKSTQKKGKSNEAAVAGAIDPTVLEAMVSNAVAQVLGQQAPRRRRRSTKGGNAQ